jgi:lipopolysaccharide export system permease protein
VIILLRYLSREVLSNTLGLSLLLLMIFLSQRFVRYLANAAAGDIEPAVLMPLILYRIPGFLELILPLALFIALLLVYGRLYLDNEMRVLFSAGISRLRLLALTFVPVALLATLLGAVSLWLSPWCLAQVQLLLKNQENRSELDSLAEGRFQPFRNGSGVIYVERMSSLAEDDLVSGQSAGKKMQGVYIFQGHGGTEDDVVIVAKQGRQMADERGRYLLLEEGYRLRTVKESQHLERVDFARYGQRIEVESSAELRKLKVDAVPTAELRASSRADYQAAWQWRISLILLMPVVALLAIAFSKVDARQGRYLKVLPVILLYLVYLVMLNMVRDQLAEGKLSGILPFLAVHALFLCMGVLVLMWEDIQRYLRYRPQGSAR